MHETVLVDQRDGVAVITIDRNEVRNAIDPETSQAVDAALTAAEADSAISAVVIAGGDKAFCTGMDLKYAALHGVEKVMIPGRGFCGLTGRQSFLKPLIAAVNGYAVAGGFELALACDFIIAGENAQFGLPEVKRGLFAGAGGIVRLSRRIPGPAALEIIMTGEPVDAQRALSLGIVNRVVPVARTVQEAVDIALSISRNAPTSVRISKQLSCATLDLSYVEAVALAAQLGREMMASPDRLEGVRAFAEGRLPKWADR